MDYAVYGILQARILELLSFSSPADLPNPGIEPRALALQADSLPVEPPAKPKNTGVGSLSLLQGIFPSQELSWGLLNCRQILYQLSHPESPYIYIYIHTYICIYIYIYIYIYICVCVCSQISTVIVFGVNSSNCFPTTYLQ